jgi:hypothetical protein
MVNVHWISVLRWLAAAAALVCVHGAGAAVPRVIVYQGYLTSAGGTPVTGTVSLQFNLYLTSSGGAPIHSETHASVSVDNGQFNVLLGSPTPIPASVAFDQPYWLGIAVGAESEMTPRQVLAAAPYALRATTADAIGVAASVAGTQVTGSLTSATLPAANISGVVPANQGGTGLSAAGSAGNVLRSNGAAWTSSALQASDVPDLTASYIRNSAVRQTSSTFNISSNGYIGGSLGVGTQTTSGIAHIMVPNGVNGPRVESANANAGARAAGWEFYHGATLKGFVGVPDSNAGVGGNEVMLFSPPNYPVSIFGGGIRHATYYGNGQSAFSVSGDPLADTMMTIRNEKNFTNTLFASNFAPFGVAVYGYTENGLGVYGHAEYGGRGVFGYSGSGRAVEGYSTSGSGVYGATEASSSIIDAGVHGYGFGTGSIGVIGQAHAGTAQAPPTGIFGVTQSPYGFGIYARNLNASSGWALVAEGPRSALLGGNVQVTGTLSKAAGSFVIDHPLDPANKYLYHSFVESPDMKNIYDGNVTTDESGRAEVTLPDWFEALNGDYRYQLTVIGTFAQAIVEKKIAGNRFTIATSAPRVEVSWQVTGIRRDAYANKHRIPIEATKPAGERGTYLHPAELEMPRDAGLMTRIGLASGSANAR